MEKIKLKIRRMCCQHHVEARTDVCVGLMESGFETVKKAIPILLGLIAGMLILNFGITGCSDVPYTGPSLTVDHVDQFLDSIDEDTACLQDGFDSVCIRLLPREEGEYDVVSGDVSDDDAPIVHIYPTGIAYEFYYEGSLIFSAERAMDTTEIIQELIDAGRIQSPPNSNNMSSDQDGDDNTSQSWIVEIYYFDSFPRTNRRLTLENSGLDIRVVEGLKILPFTRRDLEIQNFTQVDGLDGSLGVQFSVETTAAAITVQVDGLVTDYIATFHINADGIAADEETNTLELEPIE